jgi:hypothetical protein
MPVDYKDYQSVYEYAPSCSVRLIRCSLPPGGFVQFEDSYSPLNSPNVFGNFSCGDLSKTLNIKSCDIRIRYDSSNISLVKDSLYFGYIVSVEPKTFDFGWQCISLPKEYVISNFNDSPVNNYAHQYCKWFGVKCFGNSVITINLDGLGLTGSLPTSLSLLKSLEVLSIQSNFLAGNIPQSLLNMSSLQTLQLTSNLFSGTLPKFQISSKSKNILQLLLGQNKFTGTIPSLIDLACPKLQKMDLSSNLLIGNIPPDILLMKKLTYLSLAKNKLNGSIFSNISSSLKNVILSNNEFSGEIPSIVTKLSLSNRFDFEGNSKIFLFKFSFDYY